MLISCLSIQIIIYASLFSNAEACSALKNCYKLPSVTINPYRIFNSLGTSIIHDLKIWKTSWKRNKIYKLSWKSRSFLAFFHTNYELFQLDKHSKEHKNTVSAPLAVFRILNESLAKSQWTWRRFSTSNGWLELFVKWT